MTIRNYSGFGSTTNTPPADTCWIDSRPVPEDRRGLIPALCSDTCRDQWAYTYSLDPATHHVVGETWQPAEQPATDSAAGAAAKPGSWLGGGARRAL